MYIGTKPNIGLVDLTAVATTLGTPGLSQLPSVVLEPQLGEIITGWDPNLGSGEFLYVKYGATIAAGNVVELAYALAGGYLTITAVPWTGIANTGKPLAVALNAGIAGNFSWFQIAGPAIVTVSGAPAANSQAYWQANGIVAPSGFAFAQMMNATFATGVSQTIGQGNAAVVLPATQAVLFIERPFVAGNQLPASQFVSNATAGATTAAAGDVTGAAVCHLALPNVGANTYTLRTAAQMIADLATPPVGFSWDVMITNNSAGTTTIATAAGLTLTGTMTLATNTTRLFNFKITGAGAITVQSVGVGTIS